MESMISKIRKLQGYSGATLKSEQHIKKDMKPFMKWLEDNQFPNINDFEIGFDPLHGHGLVTKKPLEEKDLILQVPTKFMMTNFTAINCAKCALLIHGDEFIQNLYSLSLALHLMIEKNDSKSFWGPYVNSLPKLSASPLYWTKEEAMTLEETVFFKDFIQNKATVVRCYCHVYLRLVKQLENAVMKRAHFTWEYFIWAYTTVLSRQNWIEVPGKNGEPTRCLALVPVFDLINHQGFGTVSTDFDFEAQALKTFAVKKFNKDEELVMFYGERSNSDFFLSNAFIPESNPYNNVCLELSLLDSDKLFAQKRTLLQTNGLPAACKLLVYADDEDVSPEIMLFLRIAWCKNEEELAIASTIDVRTNPISVQNETVALTMLSIKLSQIQKQYKTTIEQDKSQLLLADLNQRNSITLRVEEKTIFNGLKQQVEKRKAQLTSPNPTTSTSTTTTEQI
jgi:histone-lysine N-methyltransferase SETD3